MSKPPTPRFPTPYSPRCPSPLGFPPLAPHVAFQQQSFSWPHTPDRPVQPKGPTEVRIALPQEARRPPLAGSTHRPRSQPPPPLDLSKDPDRPQLKLAQAPKTATIVESEEASRMESEPPSPTPSDASTLSLYSANSDSKPSMDLARVADSVKKPQELDIQELEQKQSNFCGCFGFLFGKSSKAKAKEARILGPQTPRQPQTAQPAPAPQMMQVPPTKRRPSPLNL